MGRASSLLLQLPLLVMMIGFMTGGFMMGDVRAQEPKRFAVQKPQRLTSMAPSEDATVGGMAQRAQVAPVITNVRPSQFLAPGWDSNRQKYLVLQRSSNSNLAQKFQRDQAPVIERRSNEPYAYGWFGTKMHPHPHRSFGYQQNYTQWAFE